MVTTIEVWIRHKDVEGSWTLYALPNSLQQAKALVLARMQRDKKHNYEIREIPQPPLDETRELESSSQSTPPS